MSQEFPVVPFTGNEFSALNHMERLVMGEPMVMH